MSTEAITIGIGLTVVLAVGSQILAGLIRVPTIIVLLIVGFLAGALTDAVNPDDFLGPAFSPFVTLAVAVILYDAGLSFDLRRMGTSTSHLVARLIVVGVPITWGVAAFTSMWLLGLSPHAALTLGAILVVSGPTVVIPLLAFVRPTLTLERVLAWESVLIDPVGAILGALVAHAVVSSAGAVSLIGGAGQFMGSVGTGLVGGLVGVLALWVLLVKIPSGEVLDAAAQLAVVLGVAAVCDALRDDSGLVAAIVIGLVLANRHEFEIPVRRPFLETLVQLILGVLFISISATVTPSSLQGVIVPTLGLVAVLVLFARPVLVAIATVRSPLRPHERAFVAWMAPRGIVAAATASTFGASLAEAGIPGAAKILPVTFLVIVVTVSLYGLTAVPVARRLGVARSATSKPLIVGDDPWVVDLGKALLDSDLEVVLWAGQEEQRQRIGARGLQLADEELLAAATGAGAELEDITIVLLLSGEDDFNALASALLEGSLEGQVFRLPARDPVGGAVAPYLGARSLFSPHLTGEEIDRRHRMGARIVTQPVSEGVPAGFDVLFVIRPDGVLVPTIEGVTPHLHDGSVCVLLTGAAEQPETPERSERPARATDATGLEPDIGGD
ncbi:MAG TPA: cation:proton antiporter [Nocardioidaceae bacterium]|nr:cation:proton antiporter [Nocardioidaceae bacterium]